MISSSATQIPSSSQYGSPTRKKAVETLLHRARRSLRAAA